VKQNFESPFLNRIPKDAVLLIPDAESPDSKPLYAVEPGYYNKKQLLELLQKHKDDKDAIRFIADMLETGDAENDGLTQILRKNCHDPLAITRIVKDCG